jgi:hypothetical protein
MGRDELLSILQVDKVSDTRGFFLLRAVIQALPLVLGFLYLTVMVQKGWARL